MRKKLPLLLFSLPALLPLLLFVLYPFLEVVRFSTWDWSGLSEPRPVGLKNYQTLFQDPAFWKSLLVTLGFMLLALPPFLALSLVLAVVLDGLPYERLAKSLLFLPGLVTLGGATLSWYTLFTPEYGALAQFLPIPPGTGRGSGPSSWSSSSPCGATWATGSWWPRPGSRPSPRPSWRPPTWTGPGLWRPSATWSCP